VTGTKQRIVVGVDSSAGARAALAWALGEAARRGAALDVVTVCPVDFRCSDPDQLDRQRIDTVRADTQARAREMLDEVLRAPDMTAQPGVAAVEVRVVVCSGAAAALLVARSVDADLLVVGSRGRGAVRSTVAGSVALHCAAQARCPVTVVHPRATEPTPRRPRVVVGLDDSGHGRSALAAAVAEAGPLGARVDAVVAREAPNHWSDPYAVLAPPSGETHEHALKCGAEIVREVLGPRPVRWDTLRLVDVERHPGRLLVREAWGAPPALVVHLPRGGERVPVAAPAVSAPAVSVPAVG